MINLIEKYKFLIIISPILMMLFGCAQSYNQKLKITMHSAAFLNPNVYEKKSPIAINIYQLKNSIKFKLANYKELIKKPENALENSLLDLTSIELKPNSTKTLTLSRAPNTYYIGVVAKYRKLKNTNWRQIIEIPKTKKITKINLYFASENFYLTLTRRKI